MAVESTMMPMTLSEIAETVGLPLGTVKTRIRDGLIRMRDCMEVIW